MEDGVQEIGETARRQRPAGVSLGQPGDLRDPRETPGCGLGPGVLAEGGQEFGLAPLLHAERDLEFRGLDALGMFVLLRPAGAAGDRDDLGAGQPEVVEVLHEDR